MSHNRGTKVSFGLLLVTLAVLSSGLGCSRGCGRAEEDARSSPSATPAPQEVAIPLEQLQPPPAALVYGGADSPSALLGALATFLGQAAPAGIDPKQLGAILAGQFHLQNDQAIDPAKPVRIAVFDPKQHQHPMVVALGIKGQAELVAALPANKQEGDAGNAYAYASATGRKFYANFAPGFVLLSEDAALVSTHRAFLDQLLRARLGKESAVAVSVKNVMTLYGNDVDAAAAQLKQQMQQTQAAQPGVPGVGPQQLAQFSAVMDWMLATARELDQLLVEATVPERGARLAIKLRPQAGSDFQKTVSVLGGSPFKLLDQLPADSPIVLAFAMDPDRAGDLAGRLVRWSLGLGLGAVAVPESFVRATEDYWKASTGETAFAVHRSASGKTRTWSGLYGLRNATEARAAYQTMMGIYGEPTTKAAFESLKMKVAHRNGAYQIGDVPIDTVDIKLDPKMTASLAGAGPLADFVTAMLTSQVAMTGDVGIVAYGTDAKSTLEAFLGGKLGRGLRQAPGVARALESAPEGCFMLVYLAPGELTRALCSSSEGLCPPGASLLPATDSGISLTASAKDGVLTLLLDVPTEQVAPVTQLAGLLVGALSGSPGRPIPAAPPTPVRM